MSNIVDKIKGIIVCFKRDETSLHGFQHDQAVVNDEAIKEYLKINELEERIKHLENIEVNCVALKNLNKIG